MTDRICSAAAPDDREADVTGIVLPEPVPAYHHSHTYREYLVDVQSAHSECICDVTDIYRHCVACGSEMPWPCYVRQMADAALAALAAAAT
jgi:hypothetical protein